MFELCQCGTVHRLNEHYLFWSRKHLNKMEEASYTAYCGVEGERERKGKGGRMEGGSEGEEGKGKEDGRRE